MSRPRSFRITIYLDEEHKIDSARYKMWSSLLAYDISIIEEHIRAGVIIAETSYETTKSGKTLATILDTMPGVLTYRITETSDETVEVNPIRTKVQILQACQTVKSVASSSQSQTKLKVVNGANSAIKVPR